MASQSCLSVPPLPVILKQAAAATLAGTIYVCGGYRTSIVDTYWTETQYNLCNEAPAKFCTSAPVPTIPGSAFAKPWMGRGGEGDHW